MSEGDKIPEPLIEEYQDVDFDIEKEDWNLYMLDDGTKIRIRPIALRMQKPIGPPTPGQPIAFRVKTHNVAVITVPPKYRGPPSNVVYSPGDLIQMDKDEVRFTTYYEPWNVYRFKDGSGVKIKLVVSAVFRIKGKYDDEGNPQHLIQSGNVVAPLQKGQKYYSD